MRERRQGVKRTTLRWVLGVGVFLPLLARIPGTLWHGGEWFVSYFPLYFPFLMDFPMSLGAVIFFGAFNALPLLILYSIGVRTKYSVMAFWFAVAFAYGFMFIMHANLDLGADAQAALGLVFIPIYAIPVILVGWMIGCVVEHFFG